MRKKEIFRGGPGSLLSCVLAEFVKQLPLRQMDRLTTLCSAANFILAGFFSQASVNVSSRAIRDFKIQRVVEGCRWTAGSLQGRRQPAGLLAGCSARFIFRKDEDLLCAAAATGSGRPGCQMGFSSHSYLRRRRLDVKDVAPLPSLADLLARGGASLPHRG